MTSFSAAENVLTDSYGFSEMEIYTVSSSGKNFSVGDLNNDGKKDWAIVNNSQARIDFYLTRGEEDLSAEKKISQANDLDDDTRFRKDHYLVDSLIISFTLADINQDQLIDLVYITENGTVCLVTQQEKSWSSKQEISLPEKPISENSLKVKDINRDGAHDLIIFSSQKLWVLHQNQSTPGQFEIKQTFDHLAPAPENIFIADLDGDKNLDILTFTPSESTPLSYRLQNEKNNFPSVSLLDITSIRTMGVHDIDGDGQAEIFLVHDKTGRIKSYNLVKKEQKSVFSSVRLFPFPLGRSFEKRGFAVADLDADNQLDIVVTEPENAQIALYRQNKTGEFTRLDYYPCCEGAQQVYFLGKNKLLVFSQQEQLLGTIQYLPEQDRLTFPQGISVEGKILALDSLDLNSDQKQDLVYITKIKKTSYLKVCYQNEKEEFEEKFSVKLDRRSSSPNDLRIIDINQDNSPDILFSVPYVGVFVYLQKNDPKNLFQLLKSQKETALFDKVELSLIGSGDINSDKKSELLLARKNYIRALTLNEKDQLQVIDQFNCNSNNLNLSVARMMDLNSDNEKEILVLDTTKNLLLALQKKKNGLYQEYWQTQIASFDFRFWGDWDLNNDGSADLLIVGKKRFGILYTQTNDYHLKERCQYQSEREKVRYQNFTLGDINIDGKVDFIANDTSEHILDILALEKNKMTSALKFRIFGPNDMSSSRRKGSHHQVRQMYIEDINQDGKNDLAILIHNRVIIYFQD